MGQKKPIVLLVDDDDVFRTTLRTLLEQDASFDFCVEARSGTEAMGRARHFVPDLAILDFFLPEMNGLQLAQELREFVPRLPIFLVTADRDLHAEKEALSCGIDAVFSKIEDLQTLLANARVACGIK